MQYAKYLKAAREIGGIVYKKRFNVFAIASSLQSLAIDVEKQPPGICFYELVSDRQCTYLDLDLKTRDCQKIPAKLKTDNREMARQAIKLLE